MSPDVYHHKLALTINVMLVDGNSFAFSFADFLSIIIKTVVE